MYKRKGKEHVSASSSSSVVVESFTRCVLHGRAVDRRGESRGCRSFRGTFPPTPTSSHCNDLVLSWSLLKRTIERQGVTIMHTLHSVRRKSIPLIISLFIAVALLLTACGKNATGTGSTGSTPSSTPPPTVAQSSGTSNGCPSNTVVSTAPSKPDVRVTLAEHNTTINAHVGNVIEIDLPFGQAWGAPTTSPGVLQLQTPAGYAWSAS